MIRDSGKQRGIDHRRPQPLEAGAQQPGGIRRDEDGEPDPSRLNDHAAGDQPLAPDPIGERPGDNLEESPYGGVDRLDDPDALDPQAIRREKQGIDAPGHPVVEVVDKARLAGGEEARVADGRDVERPDLFAETLAARL
jgi:hypothetical protein